MKVKLLNDGGYEGLSCLNYPVVVESTHDDRTYVDSELITVMGKDINIVSPIENLLQNETFLFEIGCHCELISSNQ